MKRAVSYFETAFFSWSETVYAGKLILLIINKFNSFSLTSIIPFNVR